MRFLNNIYNLSLMPTNFFLNESYKFEKRKWKREEEKFTDNNKKITLNESFWNK